MKSYSRKNTRRGFTLIEMVGVLAVIAILAALLVPKIFAAINESQLNNCVASVNSAKTAALSYFGKNGSFPAAANFDSTLLTDGLLEKRFTTKLGTGATLSSVAAIPGTDAPEVDNAAYDLDGNGTSDTGSSVRVVQAVLTGIAQEDAWELSKRIDGTGNPLSEANATTADIRGRVKYADADPTTVYVYIADK